MASTTTEAMISISVMNGHAFVWSAADTCRLRQDHRIVGTLVGCHPRHPRQNVQMGLPLQLLPEEATLLRDKGIAELLDHRAPAPIPTEEEVQKFKDHRKRLFEEQVAIGMAQKREQLMQHQVQIREGKLAKRRKRLEAKRAAGEKIEEEDLEEEFDINKIKIKPMSEKSSLVQICTALPSKTRTPAPWAFPSSDTERHRYQVFCDLWEKGHMLTAGGKFGGDFLVYPGDPDRFHAFYIAVVVPHEQTLSVLDVKAYGRLGSSVKKTVVLCSVDSDDKLNYISLQWAGIT